MQKFLHVQVKLCTDREEVQHVFATKILPEKVITSQCYAIHILILDMSKSFDTLDRAILLKKLKALLSPDELFLIKIMFKTKVKERCKTVESAFFKTDIGVPQGDDLSANKFTLYLARAFYKENNDQICKKTMITISSELSSI